MQMSCDDVAGGVQCAPPCQSATQCVAYHLASSCRVIAYISLARVWSAMQCGTVALYYSGESTHLAGHDYVACPHALLAPRYARSLLGNARTLLFSRCSQILLYSSLADSRRTHGGARALSSGKARSGAVGRMAAPSRAGRQDPKLRDAWQHWSPPERGGGV
jgi:hypothetical protein